jgi:hypothetical protein
VDRIKEVLRKRYNAWRECFKERIEKKRSGKDLIE